MALRDKRKHQISFEGPGRTRQDQKDSCDINLIMRKYVKQGIVPRLNPKTPVYDDFSTALSYHESLERIQRANKLFYELPADLRSACDNDPALLIPYVENEENIDELVELGVMEKPKGWIPPGQREKVTETSENTEESDSE